MACFLDCQEYLSDHCYSKCISYSSHWHYLIFSVKMNKTVDKVGENLEENAVDLNLNKLSIGSALLNIATLNTDISKTYFYKDCLYSNP